MFANSNFCSAPSFSRGVVIACLASFIDATHAIVESRFILMTVFFALADFTVVPRIFGDTMRPAVSYVFAINFSLEGCGFDLFWLLITFEYLVSDVFNRNTTN